MASVHALNVFKDIFIVSLFEEMTQAANIRRNRLKWCLSTGFSFAQEPTWARLLIPSEWHPSSSSGVSFFPASLDWVLLKSNRYTRYCKGYRWTAADGAL